MKLVATQTEESPENEYAVSWYAYFQAEPGEEIDIEAVKSAVLAKDPGFELDDLVPIEEMPSDLSRHTGLRRFHPPRFD